MKIRLLLIIFTIFLCILMMNWNPSYSKTHSIKTKYEGMKKYFYNGSYLCRKDGQVQKINFFPDIEAQNEKIAALLKRIGAGTNPTSNPSEIWQKFVRTWVWLQKNTLEATKLGNGNTINRPEDPRWKKAWSSMYKGDWPSINLIAETYLSFGFVPIGTCMHRAQLLTTLLYRVGIPKDIIAIAETRWKPEYSQHMYTILYLKDRWHYFDPSFLDQELPKFSNIHSIPFLDTVIPYDYLHPRKIKIIPGANLKCVPLVTERASIPLPVKNINDIAAVSSEQIQAKSHEAQVKKDLSLIITLKVAGQIQKTDPWTDPKSDRHNWHKPMYYIALDANGDPKDGYYDNGKGPYSALIQYDSGRYRLIWGGPDQNIHTKADNVVCPPTGWLREGMSLEGIECAEGFAVSISEDGTALIVYVRLHLIGNPASLEASFMASPYTSSHFDVLGNKPGDDGKQGWMAIPDATLQRTYSKKDAPEKLAWPIEAPDLKANFDIIEGEVQILHVQ